MLKRNLKETVEQLKELAMEYAEDKVASELEDAMNELERLKKLRKSGDSKNMDKLYTCLENYRIELFSAWFKVEHPENEQQQELKEDIETLLKYC